jgi:hypothetical protein
MNEHIVEMLDGAPFGSFSGDELAGFREHCRECESCTTAFTAAQTSAAVIKFDSEQVFGPSPFFQTKVMAALREQRSEASRSIWNFARLWQASASLVTMMVALVAMLMFAVALAPSHQTYASSSSSMDQTEAVILEQDNPRDMTNDQVLQAIYDR